MLIVAIGSEAIVPPLPGIEGDNVVIVNDYYLEKEKIGSKVVVLGGGLAGCEAAIHLAEEGKQVHLVEMRPEPAVDANIRHRPILLAKLEGLVRVHTGCRGIKVTGEGLWCLDENNQERLVPGETVICAVGQRPRKALAESLRDSAPYVSLIGDCLRASTITTAVYEGHHAALDA